MRVNGGRRRARGSSPWLSGRDATSVSQLGRPDDGNGRHAFQPLEFFVR